VGDLRTLDELETLHDEELVMGEIISILTRNMEKMISLRFWKRGKMRRNEMQMAERTMRIAGWLDECEDGLPDVGSLLPIEPDTTSHLRPGGQLCLPRNKLF